MSAKRASGREAPGGGPTKPRGPGKGAQPREPTEPTERKGGTPDDVAGSGQEEARAGEAGDEGLSPEALEEPREAEEAEEAEEEEHGEPLDRGHVCEDKGLDR
ncbi:MULTISPECIES: hypothetical protein [Sorangium]|uniref:Uncharacterized protein n=1 Tax=Sorangium cellulosum TaxID=56 RepID=A0A4P2R666_SORCE|nr:MULTISPECIES: hypothetical protein [Sorangium]AUX37523.1 uncharacterized protein SOCE836_097480 [Sorangium cellulosum]WCQ96812.1 hypothetical protein NQZ70_09599 [Sorangium sp. Soce836]